MHRWVPSHYQKITFQRNVVNDGTGLQNLQMKIVLWTSAPRRFGVFFLQWGSAARVIGRPAHRLNSIPLSVACMLGIRRRQVIMRC